MGALGMLTERRLQGMPCLGAPAGRVDVRVVGIDPEVIGVTPAIEVELGKKGGQVFLVEPEVLQAPGGSPHPQDLLE